jgi:hypothetical protein
MASDIILDFSGGVTIVVTDGTSEYEITASDIRVEQLEQQPPRLPWDRDIRAELVRNDQCPGLLSDGWWRRELDQIDGLTFHHTLSDSPHATASNYVQKGGGRPSIPYTIWVTQTGEVLWCLDLEEGCWHDHTGHQNIHLSVGLAGFLHIHRPPDVQLDAATRVAAWAVRSDMLPGITRIDQIAGHSDYAATICPGWASEQSGHWKTALYNRIEEALSL